MNETIATYNKAAQAYGEKFNTIGSRRTDIERAFSFLAEPKNAAVVELGCGNGRDAKVILAFTQNYIGIDASKEMIALARAYIPEADFRTSDLMSFEIPLHTSLVFAFASLLHCDRESVTMVLQHMHHQLKDEGVVYISLKRAPYEERIVTDAYGPRTFYFYERSDIEALAGDKYEVVWYEEQCIKEIDWFTIALKKNSQ